MRLLSLLLAATVANAAQPNILLVVADDQRFDTIRALGNAEISTPTLDAIANRGTHFRNVYCMGSMTPAVCTPSRTMLLTGRSLWRIPDPKAKTFDGPTLGKSFREAGYATCCISKPGNSFLAGHQAFETYVPITHSGASTSRKCADAALAFLSKPSTKPFFMYFAPSVPHDPRTASDEFHKLYDPAKLTLSKNFMPQHPFDNGEMNVRDEKLAPIPRTEAEMKKHVADYYACISDLDYHLGRIIESLKNAGTLDNTIVVFTSDQGLAVGGRHGLMGKQNLYEHFKSPLLVAGPGIAKGSSDSLVYLFDLFPTLCDLARVPTPSACEGVSLSPALRGESLKTRDHLFAAYRDVQRMVRDDRWKLIVYPKVERMQLFDLKTDPDEMNDLSAVPKHQARMTEMKDTHAKQRKLWNDPTR